jgi:hypothetical protein
MNYLHHHYHGHPIYADWGHTADADRITVRSLNGEADLIVTNTIAEAHALIDSFRRAAPAAYRVAGLVTFNDGSRYAGEADGPCDCGCTEGRRHWEDVR